MFLGQRWATARSVHRAVEPGRGLDEHWLLSNVSRSTPTNHVNLEKLQKAQAREQLSFRRGTVAEYGWETKPKEDVDRVTEMNSRGRY